jgi:hypothetical protein
MATNAPFERAAERPLALGHVEPAAREQAQASDRHLNVQRHAFQPVADGEHVLDALIVELESIVDRLSKRRGKGANPSARSNSRTSRTHLVSPAMAAAAAIAGRFIDVSVFA